MQRFAESFNRYWHLAARYRTGSGSDRIMLHYDKQRSGRYRSRFCNEYMTSESLREQHERLGRAVTRLISDHAEKLDSAPVTSPATPAELQTLFDEPLPIDGTSAEDILAQFAQDIAPHAMQIPSPRYFGQFNPTPLAIGVWADALCSALNQNAGAWRNGPTSALIEAQVIRWLCELIGYGPEAFGTLASGGSEANLIALKCARDSIDGTV